MTSLNTARKRKDTPRLYRIVENDFATTVAPNRIYRLYERIGSTQIVLFFIMLCAGCIILNNAVCNLKYNN